MKMQNQSIQIIIVLLVLFSAPSLAETVKVTVETDRPVMPADEKQIAYVRIGLRGCPIEILPDRPPVNVAIVIDKSGSMGGDKINKAKEAAILAIHRLKSSDIVSVVLYDSTVNVLVPATKLTRREQVISKIRQVNAGGSTALYDGVQNGAEEVRKFISRNKVNRIVLLSDGLANVGPQSASELGRLGAQLVDEGISVTTIGLGLGYNEDLMSQLAFKSDGGHYFAEHADELAKVFDQEFGRALSVVAQEVNIEIICGEGMRPIRLLGREGTISGRKVNLDIQNVYSEHEKYVLLEVEVPAHRVGKERELALVRLNYQDMKANKAQKATRSCNISFTDSKAAYEKNLNKQVLADAVEQIAIENNKKALELRDKGQIQQAEQVLNDNYDFLISNSTKLDSKKLKDYAKENKADADNLDEQSWGRQRKIMRESQSARQQQR